MIWETKLVRTRITVSTSGIPNKIIELADSGTKSKTRFITSFMF